MFPSLQNERCNNYFIGSLYGFEKISVQYALDCLARTRNSVSGRYHYVTVSHFPSHFSGKC